MISLSEITPRLVTRRRLLVAGCTVGLTALAVVPMVHLLTSEGWQPLTIALLSLFILLMLPVAFGFTLSFTGFCLLRGQGDPFRINNTLPLIAPSGGPRPATAIVMPIYNEDVSRVFQGLQVMIDSLAETGRGEDFDFFVLSDTDDPSTWVAEEKAWLELCKRLQGFGRIFYRKRRISLHHKSGNIADFCRRWGAKYRYMIVLDADSLVIGSTLTRLVALMEHNSKAGIIQTSPRPILGKSLFQRILQFSAHLYGPIFMAGANFWQLGSGSFWGHNAILRLAPFMRHCAMPELPKTSPLGTRILSHDTIEAAFMRRAGYGVWFAYDLGGSYEESPPDLLSSLQRDRRWCFGNLQHIWFLFARRIRTANRVHILNGILAYASSPLWLLFLLLSTLAMVNADPAKHVQSSVALAHLLIESKLLFAYVMGLLLVPKFLAAGLAIRSPEQRRSFGGIRGLVVSLPAEILFSMLQAPILMLFYTRFVLGCLTGTRVAWVPQKRKGEDLPAWRDLFRAHLGDTIFVLAWAVALAFLKPSFLPWMVMVLLGPAISILFSRFTASENWGLKARRKGVFIIPEEVAPPVEIERLEEAFCAPDSAFFAAPEYAPNYGLLQAILDPYVNAIHVSMLRHRPRVSIRTRDYMQGLTERLLLDGPFGLSPREKRILLWDAEAMEVAHHQLWSRPASQLHDWWQAAFRHYNEASELSVRRTVSQV